MPRGDEIVAQQGQLAQAHGPALMATPEELRAAAARHRQICLAALAATKASNWLDLGGRPYLTAAGTDVVKAMLGIRIRVLSRRMEPQPDGHYVIVIDGEACAERVAPGEWTAVTGAASSDDPFLTRGGKRRASYADVNAKAMTNLRARAVRELLAISAYGWDELAAAGIRREDVPRVEMASAPQGDLAWIKIRYQAKEAFKALIRQHFGQSPRWDGKTGRWGVPAAALELPELAEMLEPERGGQEQPQRQAQPAASEPEAPPPPPDPLFDGR